MLTNTALPTKSARALNAKAFSKPILRAAAAIMAPNPLSFFFLASPTGDVSGRKEKPKLNDPSLPLLPEITKSAASVIWKKCVCKLTLLEEQLRWIALRIFKESVHFYFYVKLLLTLYFYTL